MKIIVVNHDTRRWAPLECLDHGFEARVTENETVVLHLQGQLRSVRMGQMFRHGDHRLTLLDSEQAISLLEVERGSHPHEVIHLGKCRDAWRALWRHRILTHWFGRALASTLPGIATSVSLVLLGGALFRIENRAEAPLLTEPSSGAGQWLDSEWEKAQRAVRSKTLSIAAKPDTSPLASQAVAKATPSPKATLGRAARAPRKAPLDADSAFFLQGKKGTP